MKNTFFLLLLAFTLAPMAFAGGEGEPQENKPISISVVTAYPEGDESYVTAMAFKDKVEELGQGQIEVKVFHSGSMGGEKDTVQAVKLGSAQVVTCGLLPVTMFTQDYAFFDGLYVFKDFDHFEATWNAKPGQGIQDILIDNNLRAMGVYERGVRQLAANVPINKPEDAAGLKLRVPQIPSWVKVFQQIGFLPTPVALPELFSALQTGVVDSAEGPSSQMVSYNYNEVQDYLMMTSHNISVAMLLVSDSFLEGLTDDQRAIIDAAAKAGIAAGAAHTRSSNDAKVQSLIDAGMEQIHPDREAFMEAARPALEELFATEWSVTSWDEVMSYAR